MSGNVIPRRCRIDSITPPTACPRDRHTTLHDNCQRMKLSIRPLTPDLWPALEDLFGPNGAVNGCWCMYWRIGSAYRKMPREKNKAAFHDVVRRGPPPGLLAFDGDVTGGWCQVTPPGALPWLDARL